MNTTATKAALVAAVLTLARARIGVHEQPKGSNSGPEVTAWLRRCGIRIPAPWCAAFVACMGDDAADQWDAEGRPWDWPLPMSASCDVILDAARRLGVLKTLPQAGDIFLYIPSEDRPWDAVHTGFVEKVLTGGTRFATIEGNTNDEGGAEGYEVADRSRPVSGRYKFIRWVDVVSVQGEVRELVVRLGGKDHGIGQAEVVQGVAWFPARPLLEALTGAAADSVLAPDFAHNGLLIGGRPVPAQVNYRRDDKGGSVAWVEVRKFAEYLGRQVIADGSKVVVVAG